MPVMQALSKKPITYSSRKQDINQYLFDVSSKAGEQSALSQSVGAEKKKNTVIAEEKIKPFILQDVTYDDTAIAQVNYFEKKDVAAMTEDTFKNSVQAEEVAAIHDDAEEVLLSHGRGCEVQNEVVLEQRADKNEQNKHREGDFSQVDNFTSFFEDNTTDIESAADIAEKHDTFEKESCQIKYQTSIMAMAHSAQKSIDDSLAQMEKIERKFSALSSDENCKREPCHLTDKKEDKEFYHNQSNVHGIEANKEVEKVLNKNIFKGSYGTENIDNKKTLKSLKKENSERFNPKIMAHGEAAFTVPPAQSYTASNLKKSLPAKIFYEQIAEQLEQLFASSNRAIDLEKLMPETKWARIEFDEKGKYYVVGVIGSPCEYICYGVPAFYSPAPPPQLGLGARWLPISAEKPQDKGYWLMFQDAISGEAID